MSQDQSLMYVSDAIVSCRLRGIYQAIRHQKYQKAAHLTNHTLNALDSAEEIDLDSETKKRVTDVFLQTLVELAMKRYNNAHNQIRDLYYSIESKYF